jgi:hypothetical protein
MTSVRRHRATNDPAVLVKDLGIALAKALEQPRRALDIAEEQRDCSGRKRHRPMPIVSRRLERRNTATTAFRRAMRRSPTAGAVETTSAGQPRRSGSRQTRSAHASCRDGSQLAHDVSDRARDDAWPPRQEECPRSRQDNVVHD